MDTPAAIAAFVNGEGGIYPTGTWMIGSFEQEAETPGRPLYKSYAVFPYPRLWGQRVEYRQRPRLGHAGAQANARAARGDRALLQVHGGARLRLGADRAHPRIQGGARQIRGSRRFRTARTSRRSRRWGARCPATCFGKTRSRASSARKPAAAFTGQKTVPQALAEAERRVDVLLAQVG